MYNRSIGSPLDQIKAWFYARPTELQSEVASLAHSFHLNEVHNRHDVDDLQGFTEYLDATILDDREILVRTLFLTRLLDFIFAERETESDWEVILKRFEALKERATELDREDPHINQMIEGHEHSKNAWISMIASFRQLEQTLSNKYIIEWYFQPMVESVHNK